MAVERERRHQKHRQKVMAKHKGICHLCEGPYADTIDHVVPVALGGSDHPDNLRPAHTSCNSSKGARSYPKWAEENANMWIPTHEPVSLKERRAKAKAERKADVQRREEALQRQLERAIYAANTANGDFERLLNQVRGDAELRKIEDLQVEMIRIVGWRRGFEKPHTPKGTEIMATGRLAAVTEGRLRVLAHAVFEKYPDAISSYNNITIAVGISGLCAVCKCAVLFRSATQWRHECQPRWRKRKGIHFAPY